MLNIAIEQNEISLQEAYPFSAWQMGPLFQIAQNGAAGSTHSLRDFLRIHSEIRVNCLSILPLSILIERVHLYYRNHIGFHLRFSGEIHGEIFALLREDHALMLLERALGPKSNDKRHPETDKLNPLEVTMLAELIQMISNSFRQELTEKTLFNWWITQPLRVSDVDHSLTYAAKIFNLDHHVIHLEYLIPILELRIQFLLLPAASMLPKILARLAPSQNRDDDAGTPGEP